jgi:hypothetical protein
MRNRGRDLLAAIRKPPATGSAHQQSSPSANVAAKVVMDSGLVGTWHASPSSDGHIASSTFVVTSRGTYRFETVIADSGRFVPQNGTYRLESAGGGQILMREDRIYAPLAILTGPFGTQEWHRVGFPTKSNYLIVGEWRSTATRDGAPWQMTLTVDGRRWRYRLLSILIEEGTIAAHGGRLTTHALYGNPVTSTYTVLDDRRLSFTGPVGASTWTRRR